MKKRKETNQKLKGQKLKQGFTNIFELPKEITLNLPLVTIIGNDELNIENYKGIIEYTDDIIRINTTCGVIKIIGRKLEIKQITAESMKISGVINNFEYLL